MRSTIWKLSALATVVGLGLLAVVFQQNGLFKPGKTPLAAIPGGENAPAPNVPGSKTPLAKADAGKAANPDDPFGGTAPEATPNLDAAPLQAELPPEENPPQLAQEAQEEVPNDLVATAARTKPRTKSRGFDFKNEAAVVDENNQQFASNDQMDATSPRNPGANNAPPKPGLVRNTEPEVMEGSPPGDQEQSALSEEDPFSKHRRPATAGRTAARGNPERVAASRARPNMNEPDESAPAEPNQNLFEAGPAGPAEPNVPGAGLARGRARPKFEDDGAPPQREEVAPAAAEIVEPAGAPRQYGPPPMDQFQGNTPPPPTGGRSKSRPRFNDDDDNYAQTPGGPTGERTTAPGYQPAAVNPRGAGPRTRPQDFSGEGMNPAEEQPLPQRDGAEPIPKLNRGRADGMDDQGLTPPIGQRGRKRPNSLVDDVDDGAPQPPAGLPGDPNANQNEFETSPRGRETEPEPQMTDSAVPPPTQRRPSKRVLEIDPDNSVGVLGGQSSGVASRTTRTDVLAAPKRLGSNGGNLGNSGASQGRATMTIEKQAPRTAYIGQPLIYQIVIRNVGNGVAQQVVVEDTVPEGVAMQGSIPQAELVGRKLTWRMGNIPAGEERKVSVKVVPGAEGAVGSVATVNFVADPNTFASTDEPDAVQTASSVGGAQFEGNNSTGNRGRSGVTLDLEGPKQVAMGRSFDVRIRLTNRTNQPATGLMIRKMLPNGLQHQTQIQDLEYRVGTLAPGEVRDIPMTLTAVQPGRAVSRAMVLSGDNQTLHSNEFSVDVQGTGNR